jgi:hypothetical protein
MCYPRHVINGKTNFHTVSFPSKFTSQKNFFVRHWQQVTIAPYTPRTRAKAPFCSLWSLVYKGHAYCQRYTKRTRKIFSVPSAVAYIVLSCTALPLGVPKLYPLAVY